MRILLLEPFYAGSHKAFADGLRKHSRHQINLVTLPGRLWKWRLRTGALTFAREVGAQLAEYDLLVATDMVDLAAFKGLTGWNGPAVAYFHENQLSYPVPKGQTPEPHFGFLNLHSAVVADACWFNSEFHRSQFFEDLQGYYSRIPEDRPPDFSGELQEKSRVVYPGVELGDLGRPSARHRSVPVILWNHRWEFDKRPEVFFAALDQLAEEGVDFRVILAGEGSQMMPKPFLEARQRFGNRILHYGYAEDRSQYARLLQAADIVVSTAIQENFGMAVIEAIYCRALPLLPQRLVYPEILPGKYHDLCLYSGRRDMLAKLKYLISHTQRLDPVRHELSAAMRRFDWRQRIAEFDQLFSEIANELR